MKPNEMAELEVQNKILEFFNDFNSFRFNAGAGSGKTYALIESIRHILKYKLETLQNNNQHIVCVTYTNVAVKEIKNRLGNSDAVIVSTIHEMLWEILKAHQPQLVECHYQKLVSELDILNDELNNSEHSKLKVFTSLSENDKGAFKDFAFNTKNIYYQNINSKAAVFRAAYNEYAVKIGEENFKVWLKNYDNYKEVVKRLYKQDRYLYCKEKIEKKDSKYCIVTYDSTSNTDRLDKMKFSHDTLLEYALTLVEKYPLLRRLIIDKYPYFLIDEYQDTSPVVIKLINEVHKYSLEQEKKWLVAYFGDTVQSIYDTGVGEKISEIHHGLSEIDKVFNRRSHLQIIQSINKIRNDNIKQREFFDSKKNGLVKFYHIDAKGDDEEKIKYTNDFLTRYQSELNKDSSVESKKIDCLVLTNKLMAQLNGFGEIYDAFNNAENIYYKDLNTKFLSHELDKLDPTIRLIYQFVRQFIQIDNVNATYYDVFGSFSKNLTFSGANKLINDIKSINPVTIGDLIYGVSILYNVQNRSEELEAYCCQSLNDKKGDIERFGTIENMFNSLIRELMIITPSVVQESMANSLTDEQEDQLSDQKVEQVKSLLSIRLSKWIQWVRYIDKDLNSDIVFHTYHGTKGEEYENVAIIMEHSFGRAYEGRNKFKKYFEYLQHDKGILKEKLVNDEYCDEFYNTRNLVYVACSRAIKNLKILYLDDVSDIQYGIKTIFEEPLEWECSIINK
ncbi:ATP-dependent helicase [Vibrio cholerae]|nr:ATP-dependent helicase [Vibrio cholerae]